DATITAEVINATESGDKAIGVTLAFNTIGWQPQNILFNTVDALIGDPAIADAFGASGGADTRAYLLNTIVDNTGSLNVSATATGSLIADISNTSESTAEGLTGSSGLSFGAVIGLNKVSSATEASIDFDSSYTGLKVVKTDGGITVGAEDSAAISAKVHLTAISEVSNVSPFSNSDSIGASGLISLNDVRGGASAFINSATVTSGGSLQVSALESATISALMDSTTTASSGTPFGKGTSLAVNGTIATNTILSTANAYITNSDITTTNAGNVTLNAQNLSAITADITSNVTSGGISVGVTLAFNTIGWEGQNFLFNAIDTLFGTSIGNEKPAEVRAFIDQSNIHADGSISLTTISDAAIAANIASSSASIKGSLNGSGTAVSVGAVVALNKLSTQVQSYIDNAVVIESASGGIAVQSSDISRIDADVSATSLSMGAGTSSTTSVSVGLSVARNEIKNDMEARIRNVDSLTANNGNISVSATENAAIDATSTASSISVSASNSSSTAFSGGGATAVNRILGKANAFIENSDVTATGTALGQGQVVLSANSASSIKAMIESISASAGAGTGTTAGVSIGFSLAHNLIGWSDTSTQAPIQVQAYLKNTDVNASRGIALSATSTNTVDATINAASMAIAASSGQSGGISAGGLETQNYIASLVKAYVDGSNSITTTTGNISLTAADQSIVKADAQAVSLSGSLSGSSGGAVSVGLSLAWNKIDNDVEAAIKNTSNVQAASGAVKLSATENATITATSTAASIAISGSGSNSLGFSGGGSASINTILNDANAYIAGSHVTSGGDVGITATNTSTINAKVTTASIAGGVGGSNGASFSLGAAVARNLIGFDASGNRLPNDVQAYVSNSSINAGGNLAQQAIAKETIDAQVLAGSMAIVGSGSNAAGLSGSGVGAENRIATLVKAFVDGDGATRIQAGSVSLKADDTSTINANAGAASLAGAFSGSNSVALSVGISIAKNEISNEVETFIKNADSGVRTTTGAISLDTDESATITALSAAASLSAAAAGTNGISVSGAGAESTNVILTKSNAYVQNSSLTSAGNVLLDTLNTSTITAKVLTASAAIGGGGTAGVGASIGVAVARNLIGYDLNGNRVPAEVQAYVSNSSINAGGSLTQKASANETINAEVLAGSAAIAGGGTAGVGVSGAGVSTTNRVATLVKAFIDGDAATGIQASSITLKADDRSNIAAIAGAASLAASFGGTAGVSLSIGVALAQNEISNEVATFIKNADTGVTARSGAITLDTDEAATITALSAAASASAAIAGTAGIALSGAGAESTNVILTKSNAYVRDSVLNSAGSVSLDTTSTATIDARVLTASVSAGVGGTAGVGASIGASIARNLIGYDLSGNRVPAEIQSYISNSSLQANGSLTQQAIASQTITAEVLAGSVAIAGGGTAGVGASGSGVSTENKVASLVKAFIDGDGATGIQATNLLLKADDVSTIRATAGAASLAASLAGTAAVSLSIGVSLARNIISNEVEAYIKNADSGVRAVAGDILLNVDEAATITALSAAASASAAIAGTAGIALSGAGANSTNVILTKANAYVRNSVLNSAGKVDLDTRNTSTINAQVLTASAALGGGGTAGVGASIGASVAQNLIGYDLSGNRVPAEVQAYVQNSSINASGSLSQKALANQTINAQVLAGSVAIAGGGVAGVGVSGAGASTENKVASLVKAFINGDGASGIQAATVSLSANDTSSITTEAGAASLAASFAGVAAVSLSIGVSLARNTISNEVEAFVRNADNGITARSGSISVTANESATVSAISQAASAAAAVAGKAGIALSGAGAESTNVILTKTNAYIQDSVLNSNDNVTLDSTSTARIDAKVLTASASVGGGVVGVGVSIGAGVARNLIGYDVNGNYLPAEVQAYVKNSSINAGKTLIQRAIASQTISSEVLAGSVAIAAGLVGGSAAGAGASTNNKVASLVKSFIDGDGATGIQAASISLTAEDTSTITAMAGAASVAASFAPAGAALAIGVALARNEIFNTVESAIRNADSGVTARVGGINLSAKETATSIATATAAAAAVGIYGFSGTGADATSIIGTNTNSIVDDASILSAAGAINVTATSSQSAIATSGGLSGSTGVSMGTTIATATITGGTRAYMDGSVQTASALNVTADANNTGLATSIAAAGGLLAAGNGTAATTNVSPTVSARLGGEDTIHANNVINVTGAVNVKTTGKSESDAQALGLAVAGGIGAGVSVASATLSTTVNAGADANTTVNANSITMQATHNVNNEEVTAKATTAAGALIGSGAGAIANATSNANADVIVDDGAKLTTTQGIAITARGDQRASSDARALSVAGAVGIGATFATTNIGGGTRAYLDGSVGNASSLDVTADSTIIGKATSEATSGGLIAAGSGTVATANVAPTVSARLGDNDAVNANDIINVAGAVNVKATASSDADAKAVGVAVSGVIGAGVSIASATLETAVNAGADANTTVNAQSISMTATHNILGEEVTAEAIAAAGSLIGSGAGARADAKHNANVEVIVGTGSNFTTTQDITLKAIGNQLVEADAKALSVSGLVSMGSTTATADAGGHIGARMNGSVSGANALTISATSTNQADAQAQTTSVAFGAGIGGSWSDAKVTNNTSAGVGSASVINMNGAVNIAATSTSSGIATAPSIAAGLAGVGATKSTVDVGGSTATFMDGTAVRAASITAKTTATNTATADADATSAGIAGIGGAAATAQISHSAKSGAGSTADLSINGTVSFTSNVTSNAKADADATAAGVVGVGATNATAIAAGSNQAYLDGKLTNASTLNVTATSINRADSDASATSAGLVGVGGATTTALVTNVTRAGAGSTSKINTSGAINFISTSTSTTDANSANTSAGIAGVGKTTATANTSGINNAYVNGKVANATPLNATANSTNTATANAATTSAGLVGVGGATTNAKITAQTSAGGGDTANIGTAGVAKFNAQSQSTAQANSSGLAVGFVGAGATNADANVDSITNSYMNGAVTDGSLELNTNAVNSANAITSA
ncbi:hypothetical protein IQ268_31410, partial [Oculatella sp. LEGE 06141]|uniref:beta strand repeat-containing protein n=1 Tax=Oculatella sp. LEGE 06141 TaxID=1828648 RepID=UPI0018827A1B